MQNFGGLGLSLAVCSRTHGAQLNFDDAIPFIWPLLCTHRSQNSVSSETFEYHPIKMGITSTTCPVRVLLSAPLWFKRHELFSVFSDCYPGFLNSYPSIIYIYVYMLYFILVKRSLRSFFVCTILTKDPPLFCEYGIILLTGVHIPFHKLSIAERADDFITNSWLLTRRENPLSPSNFHTRQKIETT